MEPAPAGEPRGRREKVRAAGLDPDYWYAVEHDGAIKPGQVVEVTFWGESIALYRGTDGLLRAIENRCAHRQLKLSLGEVTDCALTCAYHGWSYAPDGRLAAIPHDLFGRPFPSVRLRTYPVRVRYGLVWLYPGDPALADRRPLPEIPELEGPRPWACIPLDFLWRAHHSLIIDNVSDFTHAWLHRKYRPFVDARLTHCEAVGDRVLLGYDAQIGMGRISRRFVDRRRIRTDSIQLCYEYPYQWSDTGGKIKHWCFVLPVDRETTRVFFLFYFESLRIPLTPFRIPRRLMTLALRLSNRWLIRPLLRQDGFAVEAEQRGHEAHPRQPVPDLNPAVALFQQLTLRKWEEHVARARPGPGVPAASEAPDQRRAPAARP
jgi:phenylpropionate dioxygenase-like ring-hydroxylating dioxygenase large terminal subunit